MADVAISGLTALGGAPATNDLLVEVDVSDTTQAPTGTTKKMTVANLFTSPHMTGAVVDSGGLTVTLGSITAPTIVTNSTTALSTNQNTLAFLGGATDTKFQNSANNATNVTITDAGAVTFRAGLTATTGAFSGDVAIATNKFTVAASTGNTVVAGTLGVTGVTTHSANVIVSSGGITVTGNSSVTGTLGVSSDFAVATTKFTVTASSGNVNTTGVYQVSGTQVLGARNTGWSVQTMTPSKINFGGSGAFTTDMLGAWASAVQVALTAHGILGA